MNQVKGLFYLTSFKILKHYFIVEQCKLILLVVRAVFLT